MDLVLHNLQRWKCHKTQTYKQALQHPHPINMYLSNFLLQPDALAL